MLDTEYKNELRDLARELIGRIDERDSAWIDYPKGLKCLRCDDYSSWCGHTTAEHDGVYPND